MRNKKINLNEKPYMYYNGIPGVSSKMGIISSLLAFSILKSLLVQL
jgi:hypothetical protein